MGKLVLYWLAALVLGHLMVAIPMGIGLSGYVLMTAPGEVSAEAFINALFPGFVLYLAVVWAAQESCADKISIGWRVIMFIVSPIAVVYFYAEWGLALCMVALALIASLAAYQGLVTVSTKRTQKPS